MPPLMTSYTYELSGMKPLHISAIRSNIDGVCGYTATFRCAKGCDLNIDPFKLSDSGRTLIVDSTDVALNGTKVDIVLESYWP